MKYLGLKSASMEIVGGLGPSDNGRASGATGRPAGDALPSPNRAKRAASALANGEDAGDEGILLFFRASVVKCKSAVAIDAPPRLRSVHCEMVSNEQQIADIEALARMAARLAGRDPDEHVQVKLGDVIAFNGPVWRYPDFLARAASAYRALDGMLMLPE